MKYLYLECSSGVSGDMLVAALLDLGADWEKLKKVLDGIPNKGFYIEKSRVNKGGIDCCDFNVILKEEENHDHDMEYLYGHLKGQVNDLHGHMEIQESHDHHDHEEAHTAHGHHDHEEAHTAHDHHDHGDAHEEHCHHHSHVGLSEVTRIIDGLSMADGARRIALKTFEILARAEAKAHGTSIDEVHFHEVGALDSIADIVSAAVCLDDLDIRDVIVPKICEGQGTVRSSHGVLPVPVPAVLNIVEESGLKLEILNRQGELVTPTGAAFLAAVRTKETLPSAFRILKNGYGAGKRTYEVPSMVRAMLIEKDEAQASTDRVVKLESNIDDCTGEQLGFTMDRLFEADAKDVNFMPVYMKKNRPAWQLNVICDEKDADSLAKLIFENTSTIGIRKLPVERYTLEREQKRINTALGEIEVKACRIGDEEREYLEYESVSRVAKELKLSWTQAVEMIKSEIRNDI